MKGNGESLSIEYTRQVVSDLHIYFLQKISFLDLRIMEFVDLWDMVPLQYR